MHSFVDSIPHPSDFSPASEVAFAHALAIAPAGRATRTLLHAARDLAEADREKLPAVRETPERSGLLAPGGSRADVDRELRAQVEKVASEHGEPAAAIRERLAERPEDLLALATEPHAAAPTFLADRGARRVARRARLRTSLVPAGARGFVWPADGTLTVPRSSARPNGRSRKACVRSPRGSSGVLLRSRVETRTWERSLAGPRFCRPRGVEDLCGTAQSRAPCPVPASC